MSFILERYGLTHPLGETNPNGDLINSSSPLFPVDFNDSRLVPLPPLLQRRTTSSFDDAAATPLENDSTSAGRNPASETGKSKSLVRNLPAQVSKLLSKRLVKLPSKASSLSKPSGGLFLNEDETFISVDSDYYYCPSSSRP